MSNKHDPFDKQDDDRKDTRRRDEFNPGVADDQVRRAEELLGESDFAPYLEKRLLNQALQPATLMRMDKMADPIDVTVSERPVDGYRYHVVLSKQPLPGMRQAEVTWQRAGNVRSLTGRVEASRPGRRDSDEVDGSSIMVAFLYP
ncbi:MAG: hypothetical protein LC637_08545 [Xanthomonadaceae bacterium]|nr:hypothetical protein [Xanthomonadaceae bacterium]